MKSKNVIRINESQLKQMISESVKKVLKENLNNGIEQKIDDITTKYDRFIKKHQETIESDEQTGCYFQYDNDEGCYVVWFSVNLVGTTKYRNGYGKTHLKSDNSVEYKEMYIHIRDKMVQELQNIGLELLDIDEHHGFNKYKFDGQTPLQYRIHDICYFQ